MSETMRILALTTERDEAIQQAHEAAIERDRLLPLVPAYPRPRLRPPPSACPAGRLELRDGLGCNGWLRRYKLRLHTLLQQKQAQAGADADEIDLMSMRQDELEKMDVIAQASALAPSTRTHTHPRTHTRRPGCETVWVPGAAACLSAGRPSRQRAPPKGSPAATPIRSHSLAFLLRSTCKRSCGSSVRCACTRRRRRSSR